MYLVFVEHRLYGLEDPPVLAIEVGHGPHVYVLVAAARRDESITTGSADRRCVLDVKDTVKRRKRDCNGIAMKLSSDRQQYVCQSTVM
jgi:hypothetical protein